MPSSSPPSAADLCPLKAHMADLARRIARLVEGGEDEEIEDASTAHALALSIKPYVDRLIQLRRLLDPVGGIIEKRDQIQELQGGLAQDIAQIEDVGDDLDGVSPALLQELQSEIAAVKRDRKIHFTEDTVSLPDDGESESDGTEAEGRGGLEERALADRLRAIFGARFIDVERLAAALDGPLPETETEAATLALERVWRRLMDLPRVQEQVRAGRLQALRRAFADYALIYRTALLPGDEPCHLANLRQRFLQRFVQASERSLWYGDLSFYREPLGQGHWALVDSQYLNCTFKRPKIRLMMYARANQLPPGIVRQKSALVDIYDRLVCDDVLQREFFANCHSLTYTTYQISGRDSRKQVYVYYLDGQVRLTGKRGIPHWRPGKPRWPGVLPSLLMSGDAAAPAGS